MIQVIGAPRAGGHRRLGRARVAQLIGVASHGEPVLLGGVCDTPEIVHGERDVLDVDVHGVDQVLVGRGRDQLVADKADPARALHPIGDRVAREERHRGGLRDRTRELAGKPGLP